MRKGKYRIPCSNIKKHIHSNVVILKIAKKKKKILYKSYWRNIKYGILKSDSKVSALYMGILGVSHPKTI